MARYPEPVVAYYIALGVMMLNTCRWGVGATTASSPPTTIYDMGLELWAAHHLVLERRALDAAAKANGVPGQVTGPVSSKSVGPATVSYDTGAVVAEGAGFWNLTVYGLRFIRISRMRGTGPVQVNIGAAPVGTFPSGEAWAGPPPWPGWFSS